MNADKERPEAEPQARDAHYWEALWSDISASCVDGNGKDTGSDHVGYRPTPNRTPNLSVNEAVTAVKDPDAVVRLAAVTVLAEALGQHDAGARLSGMQPLDRYNVELDPVTEALFRALRDPDQRVSARAIAGLGATVRWLISQLQPARGSMWQHSAANRLREIGTRRALSAVHQWQQGSARESRRAEAEAEARREREYD